MPARADRYLVTGGLTPKIYHGRASSLADAFREAAIASRSCPGQHRVIALYGTDRIMIRVYEAGKSTWWAGQLAEA